MLRNKVGEQKLCRLFGRFSLVLVLFSVSVYAESFEDFKRQQAESFAKYKDERDNAFNKYLKQQWEAYNVYKGTPLYSEPKPKKIAPTKPSHVKSVGPKIVIRVNKPKPEPVVTQPLPQKPVEKKVVPSEPKKEAVVKVTPPKESAKTAPVEKKSTPQIEVAAVPQKVVPQVAAPIVKDAEHKDISFDFFGTKLGFNIVAKIKSAKFYPQDQSGIRAFFDAVASSQYEELIEDIQTVGKKLNLNDWGMYLLVTKISQKVYNNQDDERLLSWFIFNKLGYAVKIGLAHNHIVLMHYSKKVIYSTPNYKFLKKRYYVVANYAKGTVGRLYSYKQNYPGADKEMDLALSSLPKLAKDMKIKTLHFKRFGKEYDVSFMYNKNLIDFMATYPQADYDTFFNAPVENDTYEDIAKGLKKYIDGKKASEAMNFVLAFVQKSFNYERDDQQFGREKVMFPQETLYYDKSDCEDRATLFSYLIKELFGIGVVGVKYKDHMSTALYVPMEGDTVKAGSRRFVLADPTYINANIGNEMPKYKNIQPESFIVVRKN